MTFIIWLIVVLIVSGAILGVAKAAIELPLLAGVKPYARFIYALLVLLLVLVAVQYLPGGDVYRWPWRP